MGSCVAAAAFGAGRHRPRVGGAADGRAQNQRIPQPPSSANAGSLTVELLHHLEAIKSAALSDDYAYRQLAHLTENIGPRPAGSAAANAAVEYVAAQMRELGLDVH